MIAEAEDPNLVRGESQVLIVGAGEDVRQAPHALVERGVAAFPDGTRIERRYDRPGYIVPRLSLDHALKQALVAAGARRSSSPPTDMARWGSRLSVVTSREGACWPCR